MNAINTTTAGSLLALHHQDVERLARYAGLVLLAGLLPAFLWLLFAPLSSAVVAPAYVKVDLNRRTVQHAEGGIVQEVMVRDGQSVRRGETLMILGDVGIAADDNRLSYRVAAERLSIARLDAEQSLANKLVFGDDIQAAATQQFGQRGNGRRDGFDTHHAVDGAPERRDFIILKVNQLDDRAGGNFTRTFVGCGPRAK